MKWNVVQLMVYGENLSNADVNFDEERLEIINIHSVENSNYLFVDVFIPNDIPEGEYVLTIRKDNKEIKREYPILSREFQVESHKGFNNEDVIYLIFADRFCDGNPTNNTIGDSLEEFRSTDIDGVQEAHKHGIKIIMDHVSNHIGINHFWTNNLPMNDWLNGTPQNHLITHHDKLAFLDIHGDSSTVKFTTNGWFEDYMPDLNQRNLFLKKYLIQNTLWWIEYSGIDGIREDTYPYSDQKYLSEWAASILTEYPSFSIVGEIWKGVPSVISGYQNNSPVREHEFESSLPVATDFAFADAVRLYLSGEKSISQVYETLAQDIVYDDPNNLVVFMDNHDMERAMFIANGNDKKVKLALNLLLFTRGIPVIFYGTEIGISGGKSHGELRAPFPGGFSEDTTNAFLEAGRSEKQNEMFYYLKELLKLRQEYPVLSKGKFRHIYFGEDLYVIIKTYEGEQALVIMNTGEKEITVQSSQIQ
ncbi:MAG: alpha-amylase family glycosyl hydrolase, partial [Ignavibacteriaceae bacterium]